MNYRLARRSNRYGRYRINQPEWLESRQLLATFVVEIDHLRDVNSLDDKLDLREALSKANADPDPDTITFAPNLNFGTIVATNGELVIDSEVTIDASSAGLLRIGRERGSFAEHRIFRITTRGNVVMSNVIVQGGFAGYDNSRPEPGGNHGGGIYNAGVLRLVNSVVGGNRQDQIGSTPNGGGAGIFNASGATLELVNSHVGALDIDEKLFVDVGLDPAEFQGATSGRPELVPNNQAMGWGSGIYNQGTLLISNDSSISYNRGNYSGAGIANTGNAKITDSRINGNRIDGGTTELVGGGIANYGSLTIERSTIEGNIAYSGGGIYSTSGNLSIVDSEVIGNNRTGSDAGSGGGLFLQSGTANITNSLFEGNDAGSSGGAILSLSTLIVQNSTFVNNTANSGGAIYAGSLFTSTNTDIQSSTITGNSSKTLGALTFHGSARVYNSIISENSGLDVDAASFFNPFPLPIVRSLTSRGYNMFGTWDGNDVQPHATDLVNNNPGLGPLGEYGGATRTISLLPTSPALNSGPASSSSSTDQRGELRNVGPAADRGAFESTPLLRMQVDSLSDVADGYYAPGEVSLRDAIIWANAIPGADTIQFSQALLDQIESDFDGHATITLGSQLEITDDLTILGPGASTLSVSGNHQSRVFQVDAGVSLDIRDLTLTGGKAPVAPVIDANGGAVKNSGHLTLRRVEITDSRAPRLGGAIWTGPGSTLNLQSSTLANNMAAKGAGFYSRGDVQMENATLAENSVSEFGGGFLSASGTVTSLYSTIVDNHATAFGGGFRIENANVFVTSTVVARNTADLDPDISIDASFSNAVISAGFNLVGDRGRGTILAESFNQAGDTLGPQGNPIDPLLGSLRDLGGSTRTIGILPSSPLIDNANASLSVKVDQRGFTRPFGDRPDIGAFEYIPPILVAGQPIVVDSLDAVADGDFGPGKMSLTEAVLFAKELAGANTIEFTYALFLDEDGHSITREITPDRPLEIQDELMIVGPVDQTSEANLLTINVGAAGSGFDIQNNQSERAVARISNLTIDGNQQARAITNAGDVLLTRVLVTNGFADRGAGIFNSSTGIAIVDSSTLANSTADSFGGGVFNQGIFEATNSTISSNAAIDAGGIWNDAGATARFQQSTITHNVAEGRGGIFNLSNGTVWLESTIVAGNDATVPSRSPSDIGNRGTFTSGGHNLIGQVTSGSVSWKKRDILGEDPQLTELVPILNSIPMHGLLPGSPAIDAGGSTGSPFDQRGTVRPLQRAYDIGAFEAKDFRWDNQLVITDLSDVLDAEYEVGLTLREAILWANHKDAASRASDDPDVITIAPELVTEMLAEFESTGGVTIELQGAHDTELIITDSLELSPFRDVDLKPLPADLLTLTTSGRNRIFTVLESAGSVSIDDVTITGGGGVNRGGGIYSAADLALSHVVIRNNVSQTFGGGIAVDGDATLKLDHSSLLDNRSLNGGGLQSAANTTVDVAYSSIEGNKTYGGGSGGGVLSEGDLTIMSSTMAANDAPTGGALVSLGKLDMNNTTISGNKGGGLQIHDASIISNSTLYGNAGTVIHNHGDLMLSNSILYMNGSNAIDSPRPFQSYSNIIGAPDPKVLPLADNGGPTKTHALAPDSPAIDAGDPRFTPILDQRGRPMVDIPTIDGRVVDIGSYEVQSIINSDWAYSARGLSQFGAGSAAIYGFGFDDGTASGGIDRDPLFIGIPFDTGPMTLGGIADVLGAKFGGEVRADFAGRVGFDLGVYVNSGSVDVDYDGMLNYVIDEDPSTGVIDISTFLAVDNGSLYTVSPKLGAYMDLVLELDATIGASGCLFGCVEFDVPFKVDEEFEMFAINRQARDETGNFLFLDAEGNVVARQGNESLTDITPYFDGDIRIAGLNLWAEPLNLNPQQSAGNRLADANARLAAGQNEVDRIDAMATRQSLSPGLKAKRDAAKQNIIKASNDKSQLDADVKKSHPAQNGKRTLGGNGLQVSFSEAAGSLLGIEGTVSAVAESQAFDRRSSVIEAGVSKQIGTLALTLPDVNLRDVTPAGPVGTLSASTSDFSKDSELDEKRQLAKLQIDAAGLLGPLLGIPAGRYTASLGPLSLTAQLISYDIGPQLNVTQDISAVPSVERISFWLDTDQASVSVDGTLQPLVPVSSHEGTFSFSFKPGQRVSIDPAVEGASIRVTPMLTMDVRIENDFGLDIDLQGALEALSLGLNVGNNSVVQVGPLISERHTLGTLDLGSIYNEQWNLLEQTFALDSFVIGGASHDGTTAAAALMGNVSPDGEVAVVSTPIDSTDLPVFFAVDLVTSSGDERPFWQHVEYAVSGNQIKSVYVLDDDLTVETMDARGNVIATYKPMMGRELEFDSSVEYLRVSGFGTDMLAESSRAAVAFKFASVNAGSNTVIRMELGEPAVAASDEFVRRELNHITIDNLGTTAVIGFDVDGDGVESPLTDGVLIMRYMDGLEGTALIEGAIGRNASRNAAQVRAYIDKVLDRTELLDDATTLLTLDIDDDGELRSQTDGQLITRFLGGFTGIALVSGAVNPDGKRTDPDDIADFLRLGRVTANNKPVLRPDANDNLVLSQGVGFGDVIQFGNGVDVFGVERSLDAAGAPVGAAVRNPTAQVAAGAAAEFPAAARSVHALGASALSTFQFVLANFGETIAYDELRLDDEVISRVAHGAPLNFASDKYDQLADADLQRLKRLTTTNVLGREEPVFVQVPDAAGYTYQAFGGFLFDEISIDTQIGDNGYLGSGFDLFRGVNFKDAEGQDAIRWEFEAFIQKGDPYFDSGDGVLTYKLDKPLAAFRLFSTALPNVDIHQVDNLSAPTLHTTTGFTLIPPNNSTVKPTIEMTQIAHRDAPNDPPIVSLPVHIDATGVLTSPIRHRFSILRDNESEIVTGQREYASWGTVSQSVQVASANQITIVGSDNADDTLEINSFGGPIHTPIEFDGGFRTDTVMVTGGNIHLDLVDRDRFRGIEVIDISGNGSNTLRLDVGSLMSNGGLTSTITILGDNDDQLSIGDGWLQVGNQGGMIILQQNGMTIAHSSELVVVSTTTVDPDPSGTLTPTLTGLVSRLPFMASPSERPAPIVVISTPEVKDTSPSRPAYLVAATIGGLARSPNAVTAAVSANVLTFGEAASVGMALDAKDGQSTGLHLRIHFDLSRIEVQRGIENIPIVTGAFSDGLSAVQILSDGPCVESMGETLCRGFDGDALTDAFVNVLWLDPSGQWPQEVTAIVDLISLNFVTRTDFSDATTIRFTGDVGGGVSLTPLAKRVFSDESVDLNADGELNADDIDFLFAAIRALETTQRLDLNDDDRVDQQDADVLIKDVLRTYRGDANLDSMFNSNDLIDVLQYGEYEDDISDNSTWSRGDWDGDGDFGSGDLIYALADGGYELTSRRAFKTR